MKKGTSQKRRFDRGAVLHLVLMLLLLGFATASTVYRFTLPTDGWLATDPGDSNVASLIYQKNLMGAASALETGDRLIAIEGVPLTGGVRWTGSREVAGGDRALHPGDRSVIRPAAQAGAGCGRPAVLP